MESGKTTNRPAWPERGTAAAEVVAALPRGHQGALWRSGSVRRPEQTKEKADSERLWFLLMRFESSESQKSPREMKLSRIVVFGYAS